jgi:hypothetical protein
MEIHISLRLRRFMYQSASPARKRGSGNAVQWYLPALRTERLNQVVNGLDQRVLPAQVWRQRFRERLANVVREQLKGVEIWCVRLAGLLQGATHRFASQVEDHGVLDVAAKRIAPGAHGPLQGFGH